MNTKDVISQLKNKAEFIERVSQALEWSYNECVKEIEQYKDAQNDSWEKEMYDRAVDHKMRYEALFQFIVK